jgi:NAD+ kinase
MKILVYGHRINEKDKPYLDDLKTSLQKYSSGVAINDKLVEGLREIAYSFPYERAITSFKGLKEFAPDFVITLGGDGTILRAVTLVKDSGIPIIGINLGRLGFLASIEKTNIQEVLEEMYKGNYYIEERSLLGLSCPLDIFGDIKFGLNDFTITKRDNSSMIIIRAYVDGDLLNAYWADGIIVATPTGSTGYSLSCGGPIVFPEADSFVITPIAPHNLNVRPVVIPDNTEITFEIEGRAENFLCTLDSRFETITSDHVITIKKCSFNIKLAHQLGSNFMSTIRSKLMWGLDMRN